jgi:glycine dehydrogenase subunit 1
MVVAMLKKIGARSMDELFADIPADLMLKRKLAIPDGQAESAIRRELFERLSTNRTPPMSRCFLGGGVWPHYVPAAVDAIVSRQEFYTSYTPYQPEISQGMLQVLFEYQSLMCDLLGMAVCKTWPGYTWRTRTISGSSRTRSLKRWRWCTGSGPWGFSASIPSRSPC